MKQVKDSSYYFQNYPDKSSFLNFTMKFTFLEG